MADWNWSNELSLEFLELYAAEPVLYDSKHPYRKNKKMISNAWTRIQQSFSAAMQVSELRKKKDSLMASFRHQMRKKKESVSTGDGTFKPIWFAFDKMYSFLGQMYENDTGISVEDSEPVIEFVDFDALEDISPSSDSPRPSTPQQLNKQENRPDPTAQELLKLESIPHEDKQKTVSNKRKRSSEMLLEEVQMQVDGSSSASQSDDDDECDLYGKLVAKKLRKLSESQRERLMYEIQGLFMKASQYRLTP